ncbi:MAG: HAMP domain-containing histidine kinase, partial [Burkholderiales bacterium]|nr:HAMP domain-containing histidine kinase [Burkholderiales bacterium]
PTIPLSSQSAKGFSDQPRWRVYSMQLGQGGGVLHVAQRAGDRSATQWQVLGSALGMMLIVGTTLVMWLNRRLRSELKPLQDLSEAVARFDPLATEVGLPDPTREELVPVIKAIHELGDRLASHVAHERALAAHSAHALRTPLAGIDAQLAVAIRQSEGPLQARLLQTRAAAARLQHVVSALINLFRSGGEMRWQQVSLAELVGNLPLKGAHVSVLSTEPIEADPDLLSAALFNLLDNSVRHQASEIEIRVELGDPFTVLSILDNGEGITSDRLEMVESALRGESTESGLGLGLAMTQLVARAHGGQVQIRARTDGRSGVEVLLSLQRHSLLAQDPGDRQP